MQLQQGMKTRRCLGLIRCSTAKQADRSWEQQQAWLGDYCTENNFTLAHVVSEAISASQTRKRPDLNAIVARKREINDFDTVIVQDLSRLTRGGVEHGLKVYFEFKDLGLRILSIEDGLIDNEETLVAAVKRFQQARAAARDSAKVIARGKGASRKNKRSSYTMVTSYGLDKIITDTDSRPLFRLRNLSDGRQQQLTPDGTSVLRTFPRNAKGRWNHYVRQHGELVELASGDPHARETVNTIFKRRFVDGWGAAKIARFLNNAGIHAPRGGLWYVTAIETILTNAIYLGVGVCGRQTTAEYWMLSNGSSPMPVTKDESQRCVFLPEQNWHQFDYDGLRTFLDVDDDLRQEIASWQLAHRRHLSSGRKKRRGGDRHDNSRFFLKGILRCEPGNHLMTGRSCSKDGYRYRYYSVSRGVSHPIDGDVRNRMLNADLLEPAVVGAVRDAIANFDGIEDAVRHALDSYVREKAATRVDGPSLQKEIARLVAEISYWARQVFDLGEDLVDQRVLPLKQQVAQIQKTLAACSHQPFQPPVPEEVERLVRAHCETILRTIESMNVADLRRILSVISGRMVADLKNRTVNIELRMPSWALRDRPLIDSSCLEDTTLQNMQIEAYGDWGVHMAFITCAQEGTKKRPCFRCRRITKNQVSTGLAA